MKKAPYLPTDDAGKEQWLNNLSAKFPTYSALLGFVAADVTAMNNYAAYFVWLMKMTNIFTTEKENFTNYKNLIRNGAIGSAVGMPPALPPLPATPAAVPAGIFPIIANMISRMKSNPNYTDAIGQDLGIIGAEQIIDTATMKPVLKLVFKGGQVEVQWTKGNADAVRIEVDRDGKGFQFLGIDTVPHFTDTALVTGPSTWKYRAMYMITDELVGQWSDVISIAVG